ncbi:hypothetical protein [Jannaschia sp. LMIT008]|uniref:hypothetical protein n=1 Tax=Jannaschia maritima TaxID=3032585 RepID=UPI002811C4A5|nr:hypothetical protein [Jannaschia sp. LMIT008]
MSAGIPADALTLGAFLRHLPGEIWACAGLGLDEAGLAACAPRLSGSPRLRARLARELAARSGYALALNGPVPTVVLPLLTGDAEAAERHLLLCCAADAADAIRVRIGAEARREAFAVLGPDACLMAVRSVPPGRGSGPLPVDRADALRRGLSLVHRALGSEAAECGWLALRFAPLPEPAEDAAALRWLKEAEDATD